MNIKSGDAKVAELIAKGVMKQWMQGGVRFCSYRTVEVGNHAEVSTEVRFSKVAMGSRCLKVPFLSTQSSDQ